MMVNYYLFSYKPNHAGEYDIFFLKRVGRVYLTVLILFLSGLTVRAEKPVLTLDYCINLTLKNHPQLKSARALVEVYKYRYQESIATYLPRVEFSASYNQSTAEVTSLLGTKSEVTTDNYSSGINFRQLVYDFGRSLTQIKISKYNWLIQQQELQNIKLTVLLGLKQSYYNYYHSLRVVEVNQQTVEQMKQRLTKVKTLYEVGIRPKYDVTKVEVELSNAELNLLKSKNSLRLAKLSLTNALGTSLPPDFVLPSELKIETIPEYKIDDLIREAFNSRPDWLISQFREEIARQSIRLAGSNFFPLINSNFGYQWTGKEFPLSDSNSWGISFSIPLFTGWNNTNFYQESKTNLQVVEANRETLKQTVNLEIEQNYANWVEVGERLKVTEKLLTQAQETLDLAEARYQSGIGSVIELTEAQVTYSTAQLNRIQAISDYFISLVRVDKSVGKE